MRERKRLLVAACLCLGLLHVHGRASADAPVPFTFQGYAQVCESNWAGNNSWACNYGERAIASYSVPEPADDNVPNYYDYYNAQQFDDLQDICNAEASNRHLVADPSVPLVIRGTCYVEVSYYDPYSSDAGADGWFTIGSSIEGGTLGDKFGLRVNPEVMVCQCEALLPVPI